MRQLFMFLLLLCCAIGTRAQFPPQDILIPMRDGANLSAHLYLPNAVDSFPVILIQTPYNKNFTALAGLPLGVGTDIANSPYAFVVVDWRCFYGSTLACAPMVNRGEDGYDTVEWIAQQSWSNGQIGTLGPSALGNVQFETAREQPPHLVCAVPEVASPNTAYHHYYPGGTIRVEYLETLGFLFGTNTLIVDNPYYNFLWQIVEGSTMYPQDIQIPMFLIAGWFDHNTDTDLLLIDTLANASAPNVRDEHKILVGPWVHGGTGLAYVGSAQQGDLYFPQAASWNDSLALMFFDYYLRGMNNGWENHERYIYFQGGDNVWEGSPDWPPAGVAYETFFLHPDQSIQLSTPATSTALGFPYDPTDPSPTIGGKTLNLSLLQGPFDQAPVESRNDVLLFTTPTLTQDLVVKGKIRTHLYVSSDRLDTDFTLRLTEVYPDGRSILLGEAVQRMRFRDGYFVADTASMIPGTVYPITLEFEHLAYTFKAGQQLRLIVSSSNYPRYNRNMNTGGEMYPNSNMDTLVNPLIAVNQIHIDNALYPARIELPLENFTSSIHEPLAIGTLNINPNPSTGILYLDDINGSARIQIFNASGILCMEKSLNHAQIQLDTTLPNGVYWIVVEQDNQQLRSAKFLLMR